MQSRRRRPFYQFSRGGGRQPLTDETIRRAAKAYDSPDVVDQFGPIEEWDTSQVTTMKRLFFKDTSFNRDISAWDVSNVMDMSEMFTGAHSFNQDISAWDVSIVEYMTSMFMDARAFNQPIGSWNVTDVFSMESMFDHAISFQQDISAWNIYLVRTTKNMFRGAQTFNQTIGSWDMSNVKDTSGMFWDAVAFNQDLQRWDVSQVTDMNSMFRSATVFNGDISSWDVSHVESMQDMFSDAVAFNGDLSSWIVSAVTNMSGMFRNARSFNQDISSWDVSQVVYMAEMFRGATAFNQNIVRWNTALANTTGMFDGASAFVYLDKVNFAWQNKEVYPAESKLDVLYVDPKATEKRVAKKRKIDQLELSSISDALQKYFFRHFPAKSAHLMFQQQERTLIIKSCVSGCICLVVTIYEQPFTHLYINSVRYPAPSKCVLTGPEVLEAIIDHSKTTLTPLMLHDESTKPSAQGVSFSTAVVSIIRKGMTWYESFGFVTFPTPVVDHKKLNDELRFMTLRQLLFMKESELIEFHSKRNKISYSGVVSRIARAKKRIPLSRLKWRVLDFFTDEFFEETKQNPVSANQQLLMYVVAAALIVYPVQLIFEP